MTVVSITIPDELLSRFDEFIKTRGYYSRSEAFRDAIRSLLAEAEISKLKEGKIAATIMITYDYNSRDIDLRLSEIRHEFDDAIIENIHRHVDQKYCLEILIVEGSNDRIMRLIGRIRGLRGIQQVKAIYMEL
ncbi:MAG: nickel-responsive transcriptional regulator NikR [Candidatus Methanomethylicia archaeon]